jgi:gas vesicle protein
MKKIIIGVLIGFILGFSSGMLFYSKLLDKPEVVNQNKIKQKVKGANNNVETEYQDNQVIENKTKKRRKVRDETGT